MRWFAVCLLATILFAVPSVEAESVAPRERRELAARFLADSGCDKAEAFDRAGAGLYIVQGCGASARYLCHGTCVLETRTMTNAERAAEASRDKQREQATPRVVAENHPDGYPILRAILPSERIEIRVTSAPTKDASQVLWTVRFRVPRTASDAPCEHALVADGQAVLLPEVRKVEREDEFRYKLPMSTLAEVASSARVVGRTCEVRWQFNDKSLMALRELVVRIRETQALEGMPSPAPATTKASTTL